MESRVLSGAATISGLPKLRTQATRLNNSNNVTFTTATHLTAVSAGGNLIWGRQLRPAVLLETSPARNLKPVCASASSSADSGDSTG